MEYLVTYGWAILAIVIIAAVLWYTGVFNPSKFRGGNECGGFGSFTCVDQLVIDTPASGNDSVVIVLGNAVGRSITLVGGAVAGNGAPTVLTECDASNAQTGLIGPTTRNVAPNGRVYVRCSTANLPGNKEDSYDWTISVTYTDSQSGLSKTDSGGFVRGKVG